MTRLLFATVASGTTETVTVTVGTGTFTLPWFGQSAPAVGQVLWLLRRNRRFRIIGQTGASPYDNLRAYNSDALYNGEF